MFGWLQKKGKEKQIKNIQEDLISLIDISNQADAYIKENGCTSQYFIENVVKAQEQLLFSFLGPLEIQEIEELVSEINKRSFISEGAEKAINHVIETFKKR